MAAMRDWDANADMGIGTGLTLLEASAGTGKTYNITSILLRLVAVRNIKMSEIAVVTFTRAATAELEDRIRTRLASAVSFLEGRNPAAADDEVLVRLRDGAVKAGGELWVRRLRAAQESFDECSISTIHGFCQRTLQQNAFESQSDFDLELLEDTSELRGELVDDWLSRELHPEDPQRYAFLTQGGFGRAQLVELANKALLDPDMPVLPEANETTFETWPGERDAFAERWAQGWASSLPELYEQAHKQGTMRSPLQRTYRATKCTREVATVTAWLACHPGPTELPPNANYFSAKAVNKHLRPGFTEPRNEALLALRKLLRFGARAAACEKTRFVAWVRAEFDRRMGLRRVQSFQDLMRNLARVLRTPGTKAVDALKQAIGSRLRVALIDEFQDTDALQWEIFRELFGGNTQRLFLIGDPKQAIYGFRGANVHVYLQAKIAALPRCYTMRRNFRSDARLIDALNYLMNQPGFFGERNIDYVTVDAPARGDTADRIAYPLPWSDAWTAPLQLRFIDHRLDGSEASDEDQKPLSKGRLEALIPGRVADDMVELLEAGARIHDPRTPKADSSGFRAVHPGDVAVLTRTGAQAVAVQKALVAAGIPAVLQGEESVLATEEAFEVQLWLQALSAPGHDGAARTAATTRLFGREGTAIARVDAQEPDALRAWDEWLSRLVAWREVYAKYGFLRTLRTALEQDTVPAPDRPECLEDVTVRLLRRADGERILTNLWHLAEILHDAETTERLHLAGLLSWLRRQRVQATVDSESAQIRLERDDEAVSVMTIHKAKGLEFPVVFLPYLWASRAPKPEEPRFAPRPGKPHERVLDLADAQDSPETFDAARVENAKEQLRLLYVALTRARFRCVLYAGHTPQLESSPLSAALHVPPNAPSNDRLQAATERVTGATSSELWDDLAAIAQGSATLRSDGSAGIALTVCEPPSGRSWTSPSPRPTALLARSFLRPGLDTGWKRHSYTSITHGRAVVYADADAEREGFDPDPDEVAAPSAVVVDSPWMPNIQVPELAPAVPLAAFPAGADAGTFFHAWFEHVDFQWGAPAEHGDGPQAILGLLQELLPRHGFDAAQWGDELSKHLTQVLRTPLGAVLGQTRLCDIARGDRLNELRFDFPLAGGSDFSRARGDAQVEYRGIVDALRLRKHRLVTEQDQRTLRRAYLDGLDQYGRMAGFMTGSIDLIFRHPVDGHMRWFVADYKSNRLDPRRTGRVAVEHFCLEGMRYEMEQHHYYVQYHLYVLALHRYLRFRLGKRYDYEQDLGGVFYLFFRGMVGDTTPADGDARHGCFYDKPPFEVIDALDRLFASHPRADQAEAS